MAKTEVAERIKAIREILAQKLIPAVQGEANLALKAALHAAFEQASAVGTVAALREFQKSYPEAEDVPAAKARIHELFLKTLADFKPRASKPSRFLFEITGQGDSPRPKKPVARPKALPCGGRMPPGNGLLSEFAGVRLPSVLDRYVVVAV